MALRHILTAGKSGTVEELRRVADTFIRRLYRANTQLNRETVACQKEINRYRAPIVTAEMVRGLSIVLGAGYKLLAKTAHARISKSLREQVTDIVVSELLNCASSYAQQLIDTPAPVIERCAGTRIEIRGSVNYSSAEVRINLLIVKVLAAIEHAGLARLTWPLKGGETTLCDTFDMVLSQLELLSCNN